MGIPFLITIDTEGDNLWARPRKATTANAAYLPRFQALCERHALRPTYLTNHEMAVCPVFREFGQDALARNAAEIGMHPHAWDSPPAHDLTGDDQTHHPYLIEYPLPVMRAKVEHLFNLLEETFGTRIVSHRAGRWAFNEEYARLLTDVGIQADCSVTPLVSWRRSLGAPGGKGGSDYRMFPSRPYRPDLNDLRRQGDSPLLEAPMTVLHRTRSGCLTEPQGVMGSLGIRWGRLRPVWFRPRPGNLNDLLAIAKYALDTDRSHVEFMLHSSELMPGGSPTFQNETDIERLYEDLEALFEYMRQGFTGCTLAEFARQFGDRT